MITSDRTLSLSRTILLLAGVLTTFGTIQGCKKAPTSEAPTIGTTVARTPVTHPTTPFIKRHIYDEASDPQRNVDDALKEAKRQHRRVIIDFGGDWCGDCQVLDMYLHQSPNAQLLANNYVVAHIFVNSRIDDPMVNRFAEKYGVPIQLKGVPALVVLDANGKTLYSQKNGEFESMRHMGAQSVTDFLNLWKS